MLELRAKHPLSNTQIIERFIDGIRFMKITPRMITPLIKENLIKMFGEDKVEVTESETGWLRIKKLCRIEEAEKSIIESGVAKEEDEIDENFILNKEAEALRKQGFEVKVKEIKDE